MTQSDAVTSPRSGYESEARVARCRAADEPTDSLARVAVSGKAAGLLPKVPYEPPCSREDRSEVQRVLQPFPFLHARPLSGNGGKVLPSSGGGSSASPVFKGAGSPAALARPWICCPGDAQAPCHSRAEGRRQTSSVQEQDHRAPGWRERRAFEMGFSLGSPLTRAAEELQANERQDQHIPDQEQSPPSARRVLPLGQT